MSQRRVKMFRCVVDPQIGPYPKQAFVMGKGSGQLSGEAWLTGIGVQVRAELKDGIREHVVPYTNISSLELILEEAEEKKKPGRPKQVEA